MTSRQEGGQDPAEPGRVELTELTMQLIKSAVDFGFKAADFAGVHDPGERARYAAGFAECIVTGEQTEFAGTVSVDPAESRRTALNEDPEVPTQSSWYNPNFYRDMADDWAWAKSQGYGGAK